MTGDFTYRWRTDVHRNPTQLRDNRQAGKEHPPILLTGNIWWQGPECWTVSVLYSDTSYTADQAASFLDAVAYLDAEHNEWRYARTLGTLWVAERYMGGSGPSAAFHITGRRLSVRTRPPAIGPDGQRHGGPGSNQYEIKPKGVGLPTRRPEIGPDQGVG